MISLTLTLLLAAPAPLQEPAVEVAPVVQTEAESRFDALMAEYNEAYQAWIQKVQKMIADAEESGEDLTEYPPQPSEDFMPRFVAGAKEFAGTDGAVPFLMFVVRQGLYQPESPAREALDTLLAHHMDSPALDQLGPMLSALSYVFGEEKAAAICAKLEKQAGSANLRTWAMYTRLAPVFENNAPDSKEFLEAKKAMLAAMEKTDDANLRRAFDSQVTVFEKFGNGMLAPDIVGPDLDGVEFKLTDYKGKVIFLDFWGDW